MDNRKDQPCRAISGYAGGNLAHAAHFTAAFERTCDQERVQLKTMIHDITALTQVSDL
jgi:hypothetical protein